MNTLLKKAIAEAIGTFVLVFFACGTAAYTCGVLGPELGTVATSLAFGLVIVAMAFSIGKISGCHINPAVSLGCLLTKRMTVKEFLVYVVAQIIGGLVGALLLFGIFRMGIGEKLNETGLGDACNNFVGGFKVISGGKKVFNVGGMFAALIAEAVLTCVFVYVILNVTDDSATDGSEFKTSNIAGILIGLTLALVHLCGIGLTGTSVNPARSIATAVTQAIYFGSTDALAQLFVFIIGPLAGGALAAVLYMLLHGKKSDVVAE